jgi:type IV secretion system protein VirB4
MDILTGLAGLGVGAGLSAGVRALREHHGEARDPAELLSYAFEIAPGCVLMKDGSFFSAVRYRGADLQTATTDELELAIWYVSEALRPFAERWMFHADTVRRPARSYMRAVEGGFPDPVTRGIDEERRGAYEGEAERFYESEYYLSFTYTPPREVYARLGRVFLQGSPEDAVDWTGVLEGYEAALSSLKNMLGNVLRIEELGTPELLRYLHGCYSGQWHPIQAPPPGTYLNRLIATETLSGGFRPKVGDLYVRPLTIEGFPFAAPLPLAALDWMNHLGFPYRWSQRILPLSQPMADKLIGRVEQGWFRKQLSVREWLSKSLAKQKMDKETLRAEGDPYAAEMLADAKRARSENASGEIRQTHYTSVVLVWGDDRQETDARARKLADLFRDKGFAARFETINALEAFLGTLPGHGYYNLRRPMLDTGAVGNLLPTTTLWPGHKVNPSQMFPPNSPPLMMTATDGNTPFRLNLHDGDLGNTLLVGAPGAGKSVLLQMLAAQWMRYPEAQVSYYDYEWSAWLLAQACGWPHHELGVVEKDGEGMQPLRHCDEPGERAWLLTEWLPLLLAQQGVSLSVHQKERLETALGTLATYPPEHRTLSELQLYVQERELSHALRQYTAAGNYGYLFDSSREGLSSDAPARVFEMKPLLKGLSEAAAVPAMRYLFRRDERRLQETRPTLIAWEEMHVFLSRGDFVRQLDEWLLTLRKRNALLLMVAHGAGQVTSLPSLHKLLIAAQTRIFLPNPQALEEESAKAYQALGLNRREIELLATSVRKRHYYISTPSGRRRFELGLGPFARAWLIPPDGWTIEDVKRRVQALQQAHGEDWRRVWLEERGLGEWAERFSSNDGGSDGDAQRDGREEVLASLAG